MTPSFRGLGPASISASCAARASSKKANTRCELILRRALWTRGLRYRVDVNRLPGRPDIAFLRHRLVVFCDGDFWHGRDLSRRLARLKAGHNAAYWVSKIRANVARDRLRNLELRREGWNVLRLWETEILRDPDAAAQQVIDQLNRCRLNGSDKRARV